MLERQRCPCRDRVAVVALARRNHVPRVLAGGTGAVVTAGAPTGDIAVIKRCGLPRGGRMAVITFLRGRYMCSWFTRSAHTVVTGTAGMGNHAAVIKCSDGPRCRGMTCAAIVGVGCNMARRFSGCGNAVVTTDASSLHLSVIHASGRLPYGGAMTVLAQIAGKNMLRVLARRRRAIVTGKATALHLRVIYFGRWFPGRCAMTVFTKIAAGNMRGVLASCLCAIVTARTIACYSRVTELRRNPCGGGVAGFAGIVADNMIGRFARCLHAVVTIETITSNRAVIKTRCHP